MLSRGVTVSASDVMNAVKGTDVNLWVYWEKEVWMSEGEWKNNR